METTAREEDITTEEESYFINLSDLKVVSACRLSAGIDLDKESAFESQVDSLGKKALL